MYFCITYISKAKKQMSDMDLIHLLDESISWNLDHNITGMLIYVSGEMLYHKEGRFMQALEGNEADVREIFEKIQTDERHFNITKLSETRLLSRNFKSWQMGFKSMDYAEYLDLPGKFELSEEFLKYDPSIAFNPALDFFKQFYNLNLNYSSNKK